MTAKAPPVRHLTDGDFAAAVARSGRVLVLFTAAWCKPCVRSAEEAPALGAAAAMPVMLCDIDAAQNAAMTAGVREVPSLALYRDGVLAGMKPGNWPVETLRLWVRDLVKGEG